MGVGCVNVEVEEGQVLPLDTHIAAVEASFQIRFNATQAAYGVENYVDVAFEMQTRLEKENFVIVGTQDMAVLGKAAAGVRGGVDGGGGDGSGDDGIASQHSREKQEKQRHLMRSPPLLIEVDWTFETRRTNTAATVEVDVMPFLARQPSTDPSITKHYGGPFEKYYDALTNLNTSYVRFAPWCPNPRLVVPELSPPDCTATKPATNWNSVFLDQLMKDFMHAVCGDGAVRGECPAKVIQQISTMPSWMYVDGMKLSDVPEIPYVPTPAGHKQYGLFVREG